MERCNNPQKARAYRSKKRPPLPLAPRFLQGDPRGRSKFSVWQKEDPICYEGIWCECFWRITWITSIHYLHPDFHLFVPECATISCHLCFSLLRAIRFVPYSTPLDKINGQAADLSQNRVILRDIHTMPHGFFLLFKLLYSAKIL